MERKSVERISFDLSTVAEDYREWRQQPYESAWGGGGEYRGLETFFYPLY